MTAIIILNWNGADDTIECIQSLQAVQEDFFCIVADNGSQDDSVAHIVRYLLEQGLQHRVFTRGSKLKGGITNHEVIVYKTGENLGFAKGNNEAIRFISPAMPDYFLLLNNDTIVEPQFLQQLLAFSSCHTEFQALTPLICYNSDRNIVWNAGGKQFWGFRKYNYAQKLLQDIKETDYIPVTFLTGCALFFKPKLLKKDGGLFAENFFFGEEDFNFCLRMNREKQRMACVIGSRIYHKVSRSVRAYSNIGKIYIYYLNRFIDIRQNMSPIGYKCWSHIYILYMMVLLHRKGLSLPAAYLFQKQLRRAVNQKEAVTKSDFDTALDPTFLIEVLS